MEPGGNEFIAEADRHGKPRQLFWTWTSPNLEFATIFVGVLAVAAYGMTFWQAVAGIVIGTGLGAIAHYFLSARGPLHGVPQMVLGRLAFGFKGNAVPAVLMSVTAGVGWFATNSVSGAYALATLFGIGPLLGLIIIVLLQTGLAFFGHNLVHAFERWTFPVLAVIFAITSVVILSKAELGAPAAEGGVGGMGGFLLTVGTAFGYAAGWTPYAADYTRYLPSTVITARTGLLRLGGTVPVVRRVGGRRRGFGHHRRRLTGQPHRGVHQPARLAAGQGDTAGHRRRRHRRQLDQYLFRRNGFRDHRASSCRPTSPARWSRCSSGWRASWSPGGRCPTPRTATRRSC